MSWNDEDSQASLRGRPDVSRRPNTLAVLQFLAFELAFILAYKFAMDLPPSTGSPIWLPDSILLCGLLLTPPRNWLLYLAGTLPIRLTVSVQPHSPIWFILAAFLNDSLKALIVASLLRRLVPNRPIRFDRLHDFWIYLAIAGGFGPAISGIAGAASWYPLGREFWPTWKSWFFGDALANLVLTPLLLCLAYNWRKFLQAAPIRYLEGVAVFSGLFLTLQFAYHRGLNPASFFDYQEYLPAAFLLLAAVRFGPACASGSLALMSTLWIAANNTATGSPSLPTLPTESKILAIQLFLIVTGIPILSLAVLLKQHHRTEQSLRDSETRFRNMADTAPVMIWMAGRDKLAIFFNKGWLEFTGCTIAEQLGFGWTSRVHKDQRESFLAGYSSAFDGRRSWRYECQLQRADGEYRWLLWYGSPRFAVDGAFDGYVFSASDITDVKHAQEASLARQKLESLGVLAEGIAHDFNNLLGGIHANAELAETAEWGGPFPIDEIHTIKATALRASGIVRQLMIYAGNEGPNVAPLDLSHTVREMLDLIKISISKSAILKIHLAGDLPPVLGNEAQVQQVVMNLVLNASDALSGKDGVITVTTSVGPASGIATFGSDHGLDDACYVRLEISDTGGGMSREAQSKIFDPFFTTKTAGRGLGLAVVQGVVRAHKGAIELTSVPGQGTTFRVLWPIAHQLAQPVAAISQAAAFVSNGRPNGTVVVVEDEHPLRISIAKRLRREGLTVIEAHDGSAAVDLLRDHGSDIDLVLLDMTIPGVPSRTVVAEAGRLRPKAKLLLTSAYSRDALGAVAHAQQVMGFIRKPFQLRELVTLIHETLSA